MGITPTTQRRAADGTGAVQTVAGRTVAGRTILAAPRPSAMEYGDAIGSPHQKPRFFTLNTLLPQWVSAASLSALPYCSDCERDTKLT